MLIKKLIQISHVSFVKSNRSLNRNAPADNLETRNMLKTNNYFYRNNFRLINSALLILITAPKILAQISYTEQTEDYTWWYMMLFILTLCLLGMFIWWYGNKKNVRQAESKNLNQREASKNNESVDAGKELEWLRKNQKLIGKKSGNFSRQDSDSDLSPGNNGLKSKKGEMNGDAASPANLPIFSIKKIEAPKPFELLQLSSDSGLLNAIEQVNDEFEEDEEVRELAVRILMAFKTRNSVESLAQIALYDLSSNLRSKAVSILSEFDHESVFETILLASADPTREVRAAAARGLSRLSFDRGDAWARIAEADEEGRMIQAARAAIEGGFVERTFSRLVHSDHKFAYEGFTLLTLLIKAGETKAVFDALEKHSDMNVRKAILHVIKVTKNQKALDGLYSLLERNNLPLELQEEIDKTIEEIGFVTV